jgi:hypothetical protein
MKKKFKILYPSDYPETEKRGTQYKPKGKDMLVMNSNGVFFLFTGCKYYPSIKTLASVLPKYDVVWEN